MAISIRDEQVRIIPSAAALAFVAQAPASDFGKSFASAKGLLNGQVF
jgi:hypothetical protein